MKITHFLKSALHCALFTLPFASPLCAMKKEGISKYVNVKSFFCELAAICSEDTFSNRKLLGLVKYVNIKQLPKLFSLTASDLVRYFDVDQIKEGLDLLKANEFSKLRPKQKAAFLKKCFKSRAWRKLLKCDEDEIETVLSCLIDLCYLAENTPKEKLKEYRKAFRKIPKESSLRKYFDIYEIRAIVKDLLHKHSVPRERILKTIVCDASLKVIDCKEDLEDITIIENLLHLVVALLQQNEEPSLRSFLICIRWDSILEQIDSILEQIPELFGYDSQVLSVVFDINQLKTVIRKLQNKRLITPEELMDTINTQFFSRVLNLHSLEKNVVTAGINSCIDFEALAAFLNEYFVSNGPKDPSKFFLFMTKVFNQIEKHLGINVPQAFDTLIPEGVQTSLLMGISERLSDTRIPIAALFCANTVPWLLVAKALYTPTVHAKVGYFTAAGVSLYALLQCTQWMVDKPFSPATLLINATSSTLLCKALRTYARWKNNATNADVLTHAGRLYAQHPEFNLFKELVNRLEKKHLDCLASPYLLVELLEALPKPFSFIENNQRFIESISKGEGAEDRLQFIAAILEQYAPQKELMHFKKFVRFDAALTDKDKEKLPCHSLLMLALYRPGILWSQHAFIASIAKRRTVDEKKEPLLTLLHKMTELSKKDESMLS